LEKAGRGERTDPSFFFFAKKFFRAGPHLTAGLLRNDGGANESGSGKCSDFWIPAGPHSHECSTGRQPSLRLHRRASGDWQNGESYPVTAAQLRPIFTAFLPSIH
jgi:hypothetical protein